MPIEAITARLFDAGGDLVIAFERILPLPGEEEFDLTLRRIEARKRDENVRRRQRPSVVPLLLDAGKLADGQTLYFHPSVLPKDKRELFDPAHPAFQVVVRSPNGSSAKFAWRPDADAPERVLAPSAVAYELYRAVLGDWNGDPFSTAVATTYTIEPHGKTLAEIALDEGLWSSADAAE